MAEAAADCAAVDETIVFLSHLNDLKDPRQPRKVDHPLQEILNRPIAGRDSAAVKPAVRRPIRS